MKFSKIVFVGKSQFSWNSPSRKSK